MSIRSRLALTTFTFAALALVVSGCGTVVEKGMKPAPDWSRGVAVGQTVSGSLGLVVEGAGERVHLTWPSETDDGMHIRYVQLDSVAGVVVERELKHSPGRLRTSRLLATNAGQLHLFWAGRPTGAGKWALWHVLLDHDGRPVGDARQLSATDTSVGGYAVAADGSGGAIVVWDGGAAGGLYGLRLTEAGESESGPTLIAPTGESPAMRVDAAGGAHLVWQDGARFLYEFFPQANLRAAEGTQVAQVKMGTGDSLAGLSVGLSEGWAYVIWSVLSRAGLEAGTARSEFVAFPPGAPHVSAPARLWLLPAEEQPYQDYQGSYQLAQLAPPTSVRFGSDYVYQPDAVGGQRTELAVALSMNQQLRLDTRIQIAVVVFEAGQFKGYEMAARTPTLSRSASLAADTAGNLHLAWREGAAGNKAYYATTAPMARTALDRVKVGDIVNGLLRGSLESITGILLFPLAFVWLLPGLVLLGIWKLRKDAENLADPASLVLLVVAVVLYQGTKLLFLPTIVSYVPFSAWLDVPAGWGLPLRIGVPSLILGLAVLVADWMRRRYSPSTLLFFFSLAATDAVLTLAVYGVNFLGVF